jgi:hypothetical protein
MYNMIGNLDILNSESYGVVFVVLLMAIAKKKWNKLPNDSPSLIVIIVFQNWVEANF